MDGPVDQKVRMLTRLALMFNLLGTVLLAFIFDRHPAFGGRILSAEGFTPPGATWTPWHMGVHVLSDIMTGLSWLTLSRAVVIVYMNRKKDIPRSNTLVYVAMFFATAGLTYWVDAMMFYQPCYLLLSYVKFIAACLSSFLAVVSISETPKILALKTPYQLELEVGQRTRTINTILENVGLAVAMINEQGAIAYVNKKFLETTGYSAKECLGQRFLRTLRRDVTEDDPIWEAMLSGRSMNLVEDRFYQRNGHQYPVEVSLHSMFDDRGKFESAVLSFRDVTWIKDKDTEILDALHRAETAIKTKDRFIAVVSHELRTPMTPIAAVVSALMVDDSLPDNIKEMIKMISDNTAIEIQLIDDLLDVMRISQGKLVHAFDLVDCHEIIREALVASCTPDDFKTIHLVQHLDAAYTVMEGDSGRLRQVFWNIIRNAIKFMPHGGDLEIRTRNRKEDERSLIVITFRDSGIGIPADHIDKIFNTFEQVESSLTRKFGGLGLGLSISRSIVTTHAGSIWASSDGLGCGATITVELPVVKEMVPMKTEATRSEEKPCRLLYVEDTPATYVAFNRFFSMCNLEVTHVTTCQAALELIRTHAEDPERRWAENAPWDVLLCDMQLPDGWGTTVMEEIKHHWAKLEGVAYSGFTDYEDEQRSIRAGFHSHMAKPIKDFPGLVSMLKALGSK